MPEASPRSDARAAAQRVKGLAKELAPRVRDLAKDLAQEVGAGYRRSTRHTRLRAAVIGGWAALSLASLWIACPGADGASNALGARARLVATSLVGTQIAIENESDDPWEDVVLTLDGRWRHERRTVRPGEKPVLSLAQFKDGAAAAPPDLRPRELRIECAQGRVTTALEPAAGAAP